MYFPVWRKNSHNEQLSILPLHDFSHNISWNRDALVGFDPILITGNLNPKSAIQGQYSRILNNDNTPRLIELDAIQPPFRVTSDGIHEELPFNSILDFNSINVQYFPKSSLRDFLLSRNLFFPLTETKEELILKVIDLQKLWEVNETQTFPEIVLASQMKRQYDRYIATDELGRCDNADALFWNNNKIEILEILRNPLLIDQLTSDKFVDLMVKFKMGEAMVERVKKLLLSNVELDSFEMAESFGVTPNGTRIKQILFRLNIVSSMRSKTQIVTAIYQTNINADGSYSAAEFMSPSLSRCTCEIGRALCSHLTALLRIIMQIQGKYSILPFNELKTIFPCLVKLASNKFIPLQLIYDPKRYKYQK